MGIETKAVRDLMNEEDGVEPLLGRRRRDKRSLPYPEETEFRFFLGCLNDEATRLEYESILTKSFRCQNYLKNPGDLAVLDMQGTSTRKASTMSSQGMPSSRKASQKSKTPLQIFPFTIP